MDKKDKKSGEEVNHIELDSSEIDSIEIQVPVEEGRMEKADKPVKSQSEQNFDEELKALLTQDSGGKRKKRKKWGKGKKLIAAVVVVGVLVVAAGQMFGGKKGPIAPMVAVTSLQKGDITQKLSVSGPVSGTDSAEVVSNLHAEILTIDVKEGDRVTKDQVLASIDSEEIQKKVDIAQTEYNLAVTTYQEKNDEAVSGYAKARQDYQTAKTQHDRVSSLYQAGGAPKVDLENARNAMKDAERVLDTYNLVNGKPVANDSYSLDIESKAFDLEQKKRDLENTMVKSPIDGTVVRVNCKVGRFADKVDEDKPMFQIDKLDELEMKINVSEYSIGKVQIGQPVTISADILGGETVNGEVVAISPTGEEKGGGSSERVIPTTIRIIDQNTKLIAGITAKAEIVLAESESTWVVPISALIEGGEDGTKVAVVENNKVKLIPVETGVESDIQIEIKPVDPAALTEGSQIITTASPAYTEGLAVTVMPDQK